ncbi:MAG: hypothetical protein ACPL4K_02555, partial [Candidatus Margulisiibacteriota bacterium]
ARANGKAKALVIEDGVCFGNGGGPALEKLIKILDGGKAPVGMRIFVNEGTIFYDETLMSRVGRGTNTVSMNGVGVLAELFEPGTVELAANGRSVANELKVVEELAKALGMSQGATVEEVQHEIGKRFGERWVEWLRGNSEAAVNFRKSPRYQELLKYIAAQSFAETSKTTQRVVGAAGFATGILSFFAVEEILDIIGVENKPARFASVILGGQAINAASTSVLRNAITPAGRAYLTTIIKNPAPALVNGLKSVNWVKGAGNLLMGVGYAVLASNLYNNLLNAYGISPQSWLRHGFTQFAVGMGGAVGLTELSAKTVLGRAAVPLAVAHLASTAINLFDSDYEQSVQERAHDKMRLELAGGGTGDKILLMTDIVANLISGGAFGEMALSHSALVQVAAEDARQIAELQPQVRDALRSLWLSKIFADSGRTDDLAYYDKTQVFSPQELTKLLNQNIEFADEKPIVGYTTEPGHCSYWHGEEFCAPSRQVPIYDANSPKVLEKSAYQAIVSRQLDLSRPDLKEVLSKDYHIKNSDEFLAKVQVKILQEQIRYLAFLEPDTIDSSTLKIADNRGLRRIFSKDGKIKSGAEKLLASFVFGEEREKLAQLVVELRKIARLQALLAGAKPTEVDKQLGLVDVQGRINENSPTYAQLMKAAEQTILTSAK